MPTEPMIRKSTHDLALLIASNLRAAQLPEYVERHFLDNKEEVVLAICRGFVLPQQVATLVETVAPTPIPVVTEVHDLNWWIAKTEKFTKKHFGVSIILRERFAIPAELEGKNVIPVFDPGHLTNRMVVDQALKGFGLAVYEEADVMRYKGSEQSDAPTLHFIDDSVTPDADTMGLSPNDLRKTKKSYLRLRGYGLAFAVYHFTTGKYLDPETFTWFPEDRLSDGRVANGYWSPGSRKVRFYWRFSDNRDSRSGGRVAIPVPRNP